MINLPIDFKNNKRQAIMLIAVVSALLFVVYFNFVLMPHIRWAIKAVVNMNAARTDLKNAEGDIARMPKFRSDIMEYKEKVERYEKMLPAEQEIPSLLEGLSTMAKNAGVKISGITPAIAKEEKSQAVQIYKEIPILISAKSGYHELGKFLYNLENSERFMKVVDIEIKANKSTPKKHDVESLILTYILLKR